MPRKKIVTAENIIEVTNKLKRLKRHQDKKIKVGETDGGQPIYRYPSITKALIARVLKVSSDYLTSVKCEDIRAALKSFGQRRVDVGELEGKPNPNTKEYYRLRSKELLEEVETLKKENLGLRTAIYENEKVVYESENIIEDLEFAIGTIRDLREELSGEKAKNNRLRANLASARFKNDMLENK